MQISKGRAIPYLSRKGKYVRKSIYGFLLSICPKTLCNALLNWSLRRAAKERPSVPFALADASFGNRLVFVIRPKIIKYGLNKSTTIAGRPTQIADWFLLPGEWEATPVETNAVYQCMRDILRTGEHFRNSKSYQATLHKIRTEGPHRYNGRRIVTEADLDEYFARYLDVANSMRFEGYKAGTKDSRTDPYIGVAIASDGSLIHFRKGHHRFALSKELCVPSVQVKVLAIHTAWFSKSLGRQHPTHKLVVSHVQHHFERLANAAH